MKIHKAINHSNNLSPEKIEAYKMHSEKWQQSGVSQLSYCQTQGINYNTFLYVRSKFSKPPISTSPKFIPVKSLAPITTGDNISAVNTNILLNINNVDIEVPAILPAEKLTILFKVLGVIK